MISNTNINYSLNVDLRFYEFLSTNFNNNRICKLILSFSTIDSINFISPCDEGDFITFLPKSKYKKMDLSVDPYGDLAPRSKMRVGKLVGKLFLKKVIKDFIDNPTKEIEEFVNLYKAHFDGSNSEFVMVEGEDVRKFYLDRNYFSPCGQTIGTIWNSCMRYENRQAFLDLYVKNPNQFKMLVLFDKSGDSPRVKGRALMINAQYMNGDPIKIMDRIYTVYDSDVNKFKKWASENGWVFKFEQNAKTKVFFNIGNENKILHLKLKLDKAEHNYYPYLDTFSFFNSRKGILYNFDDVEYDYTLIQFNGSLEREEREERINNIENLRYIDDQILDQYVTDRPIIRQTWNYGNILNNLIQDYLNNEPQLNTNPED